MPGSPDWSAHSCNSILSKLVADVSANHQHGQKNQHAAGLLLPNVETFLIGKLQQQFGCLSVMEYQRVSHSNPLVPGFAFS